MANSFIYIYFNKQGVMTTQIAHGSAPIRQGSSFDIYVLFDTDFDIENKVLELQFKAPGEREFSNIPHYLEYDFSGLYTFKKINAREITYDLVDGRQYHRFKFTGYPGMGITDKWGNLQALLTIYENVYVEEELVQNISVEGLIHLYIEKTFDKPLNTTIDKEQYNYLKAYVGSLFSEIVNLKAIDEELKQRDFDISKLAITKNLMTNLNGYHFGGNDYGFERIANDKGIVNQLQYTSNGEIVLDTTIIANYMEAMTGNKDYHEFNLTKPVIDYIITFEDFTLWKIQYEKENGLLAYKLTNLVNEDRLQEIKTLIENNVAKNYVNNDTLVEFKEKLSNGHFKVGKAIADEEGRSIVDTYAEQKDVVDTFVNISNGTFIVGKSKMDEKGNVIFDTYAKVVDLTSLKEGLKDGTFVVMKATKDGNGNVISETYTFKSDFEDLENALGNGAFIVKKAQNANNSTNDGEGNKITTTYVKSSTRGTAGGVATLGNDGKIPSSQLPSYVDDVLEFTTFESLPSKGESGKIYLVTSTNKSYRWSGSTYVEISSGGVSLGFTSETAYPGNLGDENRNAINELRETHFAEFSQLQEFITQKHEEQQEDIDNVDNKINEFFLKGVGQETVASEGGWQGTAVPVDGATNVEKIYINTSMSTEEVIAILNRLTYYAYMEPIEISLVFSTNDGTNLGILHNENMYYIGNPRTFEFCFAYIDGVTEIEEVGFSGWKPEFNGVIEVNAVSNTTQSNTTSVPVGTQNDLISSLFSITPFVQSSGEEKTTLYQMNADGTLNKDKPIQTGLSKEEVVEIVKENSSTTNYGVLVGQEDGTLYKMNEDGTLNKEEVLSENVEALYDVVTSSNVDVTSDTQIPTSKAVQNMIDNALGDVERLLEVI